jgi:hypothetical protein
MARSTLKKSFRSPLRLTAAALALGFGVGGACTDELPVNQVCDDAGYAISNRVYECTGDPDQANARYDWYKERFSCITTGWIADDDVSVVPDNDPRSPHVTYECVAAMRALSCETVLDDAALDRAITEACAGVVSRDAGELPPAVGGAGGEGAVGAGASAGVPSSGGMPGAAGAAGTPGTTCEGNLLHHEPPITSPLPGNGSVHVGDVNNDGYMDVVQIAFPEGVDTGALHLGRGDGTFQPALPFGANWCAGGPAALGDLNGDLADDVVCGSTAATVFVTNNGNLGQDQSYGSGTNLLPLLGDLDGDVVRDLLISDQLTFFPGLGDGTFDVAGAVPLGAGQYAQTVIARVNPDTYLDVIGLFDTGAGLELHTHLGTGTGLGPEVVTAVATDPTVPKRLYAADLTDDAVDDLVLSDVPGGEALILQPLGDGTFAPGQPLPFSGELGIVDLNEDGWVDVVTHSPLGLEVWIHTPNTVTTFDTQFVIGSHAVDGGTFASTDFNLDGLPDLVTTYGDTLGLWLGCRE